MRRSLPDLPPAALVTARATALLTALLTALAAAPLTAEAAPGSTAGSTATAAPSASAAASTEPSPISGEPAVQRQVLEDDNVRIEELRVRGVNQRLVVRPKIDGVREYEILPGEPGRDSAQDRRSAGQRVWRLLSF